MAIKIPEHFDLQEKLQHKEDLLKQVLELLSKATTDSDKKRLNFLAGTNLRDLGFINILLKNFDEAKKKFSEATKYQKAVMEIERLDYWFDVVKNIDTAVLSLDIELMRESVKQIDWTVKTDKNKWYPTAYEQARLILGTNSPYQEEFDISKVAKAKKFFLSGVLALQAIQNKDLPLFKESITQLVHTHQGESGGGYSVTSIISPDTTALMILAHSYGLDLGDFDPLYVPMDYVFSEKLI